MAAPPHGERGSSEDHAVAVEQVGEPLAGRAKPAVAVPSHPLAQQGPRVERQEPVRHAGGHGPVAGEGEEVGLGLGRPAVAALGARGGVHGVVGEPAARVRRGERREGVGGPGHVALPVEGVGVEERCDLPPRRVQVGFRRRDRQQGRPIAPAASRGHEPQRRIRDRPQRRVERDGVLQPGGRLGEAAARERRPRQHQLEDATHGRVDRAPLQIERQVPGHHRLARPQRRIAQQQHVRGVQLSAVPAGRLDERGRRARRVAQVGGRRVGQIAGGVRRLGRRCCSHGADRRGEQDHGQHEGTHRRHSTTTVRAARGQRRRASRLAGRGPFA
jgi:hypothetical protein